MEVIRAVENWQRAAAFYVRIEAMVKGFGIPAEVEIDEKDTPDAKYIVVFDGVLPVACSRLDLQLRDTAKIERVVVLERYRNKGIGRLMIEAAQDWIRELGYKKIVINSRDEAVGFYEKLGYTADRGKIIQGAVFPQIYTFKEL